MKKGVHPTQKKCHVKCACGNEFEIMSNKEEFFVESCPKCHSFYTGKFKTTKTGNVQKFRDKYGIKE